MSLFYTPPLSVTAIVLLFLPNETENSKQYIDVSENSDSYSDGRGDSYRLDCYTMYSARIVPTFNRNILLPSSG
jgi:hypothetical protein